MLHWVKKWHRLEDTHIQENIKPAQNLSMLLIDEVSTDWAFLENQFIPIPYAIGPRSLKNHCTIPKEGAPTCLKS